MIATNETYKCKIFYLSSNKKQIETKNTEANVFISHDKCLKCLCERNDDNYTLRHLLSVKVGNKWLHPLQFQRYIEENYYKAN